MFNNLEKAVPKLSINYVFMYNKAIVNYITTGLENIDIYIYITSL